MELAYEKEQHVRKPFAICAIQLAGGVLLKMLKYFQFFHVKEIVKSLLVSVNKSSSIIQSCFFTKTIKQNLHQFIFLPYRTSMGEK